MEREIFDQWVEGNWSSEPCESQLSKNVSAFWPNFTLNEPLPYNFEDIPAFDEFGASCSLPNAASPSDFELPSPISDFSSLSEEFPVDQESSINPWVIPSALGPATSPTMEMHDLASPAGSSLSSSPQEPDYKPRTKRSTKQGRRNSTQSNDSRATSSGSNRHNAHNLIEKRYRNNLNSKIQTLRDCIPSLRAVKEEEDEDDNDMNSDAGESRKARKCNKGVILDKAVQYITDLEKHKEKLLKENARLKSMVDGRLDSYLYANGTRRKGLAQGQVLRAF